MRTGKNHLLDENYRRSLKSTLMVVEKLLVEMEDLLLHNTQSLTWEVKDDIDPEMKAYNLSLIQDARSHIGKLMEKYGIEKNTRSMQRMIDVKKVKIWEVLSNSKSERLKGFGKLNQSTEVEFNNDIDALLATTEKIVIE